MEEIDLIGTEWVCPRCKEKVVITEKGLQHYSDKDMHWFSYSLKDYVGIQNWYKTLLKKSARKMMYGDTAPKSVEETFYYVNLKSTMDNEHATGMKSRLTGQIYLLNGYEVDKTKPIEDSKFVYDRDSRPMDL